METVGGRADDEGDGWVAEAEVEGVGLGEGVVDEAAMPAEADERVAEPESGDELVMGEPAQPVKMTSPKQTITRSIRVVEVPTTRLTLFALSLDGPFRSGRCRPCPSRPASVLNGVFQLCCPQRHWDTSAAKRPEARRPVYLQVSYASYWGTNFSDRELMQ